MYPGPKLCTWCKACAVQPSMRPLVALFSMLCKIQAHRFVLSTHPKPNRFIYDEQNEKSADDRQSPCNRNAHRLVEHLAPVPLEQTRRLARAKDRIDRAVRKEP